MAVAVAAAVVAASGVQALPAKAEPPAPVRLSVRQPGAVTTTAVKPRPRPADLAQGAAPRRAPAAVWPVAGVAEVRLDAAPVGRSAEAASPPVRAGKLPVWVGAPVGSGGTTVAGAEVSGLRARLLDRAQVPAGWRDGLLLRLDQAQTRTARGRVSVTVDYASFASAYGADWSTRLRLLAVPECALTTPAAAHCQARPLASRNTVGSSRVSADVDLGTATGGSTLLAVTAAESGAAGDYAATPLQQSAAWVSGGSSGSFSWSYPMKAPDGLGGPTPNVGLSYSSDAVDGRSDASNNQPSWIGEGFDYWPGYIQRQYKPCIDDKGGTANNTKDTGDQCWGTDNAVMTFNGKATELVRDGATGVWKPKVDDGSRIQRLTDTDNADNDNEYWKVTTADGTQYFFGLNRLTGWTSGKATTDSVWTVPVAGNNTGEPCRQAAYTDSFCDQAWRWNLDYVVDTNGNTMSMWYAPESNKYARNVTDTDVVSYHRGGVLNRIDYGTNNRSGTDTVYTATKAPMRVEFAVADRCLVDCADKANWPDTPKDRECTGTSCPGKYSPTFWTTHRLSSITTGVWSPSANDYRDVDSWAFTHTFPPNGDATRDGMWLEKIVRTGQVGTAASLPEINFDWVQLANRVDTLGDTKPPMFWMRMGTIWTESGGKISIAYESPECVPGSNMPSAPETNTKRCYPALSEDPLTKQLRTDYFHKYVVKQVTEADWTGGGTDTVTRYEYLDGVAWRHTDDDGMTKDKFRTWSDYRGYGRVQVRKGMPGSDTLVETRYYRGMHGDKVTPTETRTVTLPAVDLNRDGDTTDAGDAPAINDEDAWAGMVRQATIYNGVDTDTVSTEVHRAWQSAPTASRDMGDTIVRARYVGTDTTWSATKLDAAPNWRITKASTTFDGYGAVDQVSDDGDLAVTGDESCVDTTYARNTGINLLTPVAREQTFALVCGQAPTGTDDVIDDVRNSYDDHAYYADGGSSDPPTQGNVTKVEQMKDWTGTGGTTWLTTSRTGYDDYGRVTDSWDVRGNQTTTTYTPATGPVTQIDTKVTIGSTVYSTSFDEIDPARASVTAKVDVNGKRTDLEYDAFGRLTKVWLPNRLKASNGTSPSMEYSYLIRNSGGVNAVTTRTLNAAGSYLTTYTLFDGLLRERQTQTASLASPGTVYTEKIYDSAGRVSVTTDRHYEPNETPGTNLRTIDAWTVKSQTVTEYDRVSRVTASILRTSVNNALVEKWRTTTRYGGDRTYVTPPLGGTPTTTIVDARGNTVELRQHAGGSTAGAYDAQTSRYNRKNQLVDVKDAAGNTWSYGYDVRGRQASFDDPDRGTVTSTYNDAGDVTSTTGPSGKLVYEYDALGRKVGVYDDTISATTRRAAFVYDPTGAKGQLASSSRWEGDTRTDEYKVRVRGYSDLYQSTGEDYVIPSAAGDLAGTYIFTRNYAPDGISPTTMAYPNAGGLGGETLTHTYDSVTGLPEQIRTNFVGAGQYVTNMDYTVFGDLGLTEFQQTGQSWVQRSVQYDEVTNRLSKITAARQTAPQYLADVNYKYDDAGNIIRIADFPSGGSADIQCFNSDHLRRLIRAWTPSSGDCNAAPSTGGLGGPAPYWMSWTFDPAGTGSAGNVRSEVTHRSTGNITRSYVYPTAGANRPHTISSVSTQIGSGAATTENYGYNTAGDTTCRPAAGTTSNTCPTGTGSQGLDWDREGHLSKLTEGTSEHSYVYAADGIRLIARDPGGATLYLPNQEIRYTKSTGIKTATRYYSHGGQPFAMRKPGAGITWLLNDHQGTQQIAVNAGNQAVTQRRQTPYGTARPLGTNPTWPNAKGFVGGDVDGSASPTGLVHLGARQYDPETGGFISADPILDFANPRQAQGYSYSGYSPVTFADPTGEYFFEGSDGDGLHAYPVQSAGKSKGKGGGNKGGGKKYIFRGKPYSKSRPAKGPGTTTGGGPAIVPCKVACGEDSPSDPPLWSYGACTNWSGPFPIGKCALTVGFTALGFATAWANEEIRFMKQVRSKLGAFGNKGWVRGAGWAGAAVTPFLAYATYKQKGRSNQEAAGDAIVYTVFNVGGSIAGETLGAVICGPFCAGIGAAAGGYVGGAVGAYVVANYRNNDTSTTWGDYGTGGIVPAL